MNTDANPTRVAGAFRELRERQAKGLIVYLTAGDPSLEATGELLVALDRARVDVIELGVPFSDPLADGPVIQRASERALRAGTTLRRILERFPGWRARSASCGSGRRRAWWCTSRPAIPRSRPALNCCSPWTERVWT